MHRNTNPRRPVAAEQDAERMRSARGLVYGTLAGVGFWLVVAVATAVAARLLF